MKYTLSKRRGGASSGSRKTKSRSSGVSQTIFNKWEQDVIKNVPKLLKEGEVRSFNSILICLEGLSDKQNYRFWNVVKGNMMKVRTRKWKARSSKSKADPKTSFIAFDLRGPTFLFASQDKLKKNKVFLENGEFLITETENQCLFKNAKGVETKETDKAFGKRILKEYHTLGNCVKDPSTDNDLCASFEKWISSVRAALPHTATEHIRLRFADKPQRRTPNLRLVVPATKVKKNLKHYYIRNRGEFEKCPEKDLDQYYMAVDVNDSNEVTSEHVTANMQSDRLDYVSSRLFKASKGGRKLYSKRRRRGDLI